MRRTFAAILFAGLIAGLLIGAAGTAFAGSSGQGVVTPTHTVIPATPSATARPTRTPAPTATATPLESIEIIVYKPTEGQSISFWGDFDVSWSRVEDTLFYRVFIDRPQLTPDDYDYIEFRYVPDTVADMIHKDPVMKVEAGLLEPGYNHTLVVTAYYPGQKLIDQYGGPDPFTGIWPYIPTWLPLDQYVIIGQSDPRVFYVDP